MSYGYSQRLVDSIKNDDSKSLGVALGKFILRNNIPVAEVSEALGVSRMTIYNWLIKDTHPAKENSARIIKWMRNYKKAKRNTKEKNVPL